MGESRETWRLGHRPALDGLRAVAVLLVLAAHTRTFTGDVDGGNVGVTIFFTLSGFLITSVLLQQRDRTGRITLSEFYRRRALRLVPAMLVTIALAVAVEIVVLGRIGDWSLILGSLTYTSNFVMVDGTFPTPTGLGHMWSLGIEEQFYLVWPLVVIVVARFAKLRLAIGLVYVVLAVAVVRVVLAGHVAGWARVYFAPDMRADSLLIGCAVAFAFHGARVGRRSHGWVVVPAAAVILLDMRVSATAANLTNMITPLVVGLSAGALVWSIALGGQRWLAARPLVWVGKRSYGLYLYQGPVLLGVHQTLGLHRWADYLVSVPLIFGCAALSWRYVEQPFLQRRSADASNTADHVERGNRLEARGAVA